MKPALRHLGVIGIALFVSQTAAAACPLPGQKLMFVVDLYFGQTKQDGTPVPAQLWTQFLRTEITPRFPDGMTIYDANGQYMDQKTHTITREGTKVVTIATDDTAQTRRKIVATVNAWKSQAKQQSVGVITHNACAVF